MPSTDFIGDVFQVMKGRFSDETIDNSSFKVLTSSQDTAGFSARIGAYTILVRPGDPVSGVHEFTSAVVSIDSLINGGQLPNFYVNDIVAGQVTDLKTLSQEGGLTGNALIGKIIGLLPEKPQPTKLHQLELRRSFEEAI